MLEKTIRRKTAIYKYISGKLSETWNYFGIFIMVCIYVIGMYICRGALVAGGDWVVCEVCVVVYVVVRVLVHVPMYAVLGMSRGP